MSNFIMVEHKKSIRFFNDREVRAVWDDAHNKWWYSVLDIIAAINEQDDYQTTRNYWKYLKTKLKKENNELVSVTNQLKLQSPDGKQRLTDMLDGEGVVLLAKAVPNVKAMGFLDWFTYSDNTIDGQSKKKAYQLFESVSESTHIKDLVEPVLTPQIDDREMFMKGIDYFIINRRIKQV